MRVREITAAAIAATLLLAGWTLAQGAGLGEVKSCGTLVEWPTDDPDDVRPLEMGSAVLNESTVEARSGAASIEFAGGQKLQMMEGAQVSVVRKEQTVEEEGARRQVNVWTFKVDRGVGIVDAHDDAATMTEMAVSPGTIHFGGTRVRAEAGAQGNVQLAKVTMETGSGILELMSKKGRLILPDETIILARIDKEKWVMTIKVLRGPIVYRRSEKEVGVRCETGKVLVLDLTPAVRPKRWSGMLLSMATVGGGRGAFGPVTPEGGGSGEIVEEEEPYPYPHGE
ncbi:MAG TPA: hypothetical protein PL033_20265 [Candidatus Brocadiia bacterium]|nr:hypothetical protein [Candidatus Brocadiia bacterium]